MRLISLCLMLVLLLSACCETVDVPFSVIEKIHHPTTTSICTKVGNIYVPSHGGFCSGAIEIIPEKFRVKISDGYSVEILAVGRIEWESVDVGDTVIRKKCIR